MVGGDGVMDYAALIMQIAPSLLVGVFMAWFNRAQKRRDKETNERAKARTKESLLGLKMQFATAKMAFSTAKAMQDGKVNGEIKEGIESYHEAKQAYTDFLNEQAFEHVDRK